MTNIVDRRLNGKNKSAINREKFKQRYKEQIKKAVADAVSKRKIGDIKGSKDILINKDYLTEPTFRKSKDSNEEWIHPGNKDYVKGDTIQKPEEKGGIGGAGNSGGGEDDFLFTISPDEFMEAFFEDLELPNNIKTTLQSEEEYKLHKAGFVSNGLPSNLNIIRSFKNSISRKIALEAYYDDEIEKEEDKEIKEQLLQDKNNIAFLEELDLRFNHREKKPEPSKKAVIFFLLDVSGSMGTHEKDLAKRFFILLYMFIKKQYGKSDVIFVKHHSDAKEVDEEDFFYGRETGGTVVSTGLTLINKIIDERYADKNYNIYIAQSSDGDNYDEDNDYTIKILQNELLPKIQYMFYLQVARGHHSELLKYYLWLAREVENFSADLAVEINEIYPVFRKFFEGE